jgi:hypothetical protein
MTQLVTPPRNCLLEILTLAGRCECELRLLPLKSASFAEIWV